MNYQERPEYTRIISTAGWSYNWSDRRNRIRYTLTPIDINYVYLPESTNRFHRPDSPDNPLLRYSYEDHFIMRTGFNYYYTNKRTATPWSNKSPAQHIHSPGKRRNSRKRALRAKFDFRQTPRFPDRSLQDFRNKLFAILPSRVGFLLSARLQQPNPPRLQDVVGLGVALYGNSAVLPFEKRFYGGVPTACGDGKSALSVPVAIQAANSVSDFIHQCGDIRLDLSVEYRAKLFWILEGALFVDAGNIWTIRDYTSQPYGGISLSTHFIRNSQPATASDSNGLQLLPYPVRPRNEGPRSGSEPRNRGH